MGIKLPVDPGFLPPASGVPLMLFPADPSYDIEIQRAPDSAGSPNVGSAATIGSVRGTDSSYIDSLPLDGTLRWYRIRHVGNGDTPSAYTDWVSSKPVPIPTLIPRSVPPTTTIPRSPTDRVTLDQIVGNLTNDGNAQPAFGVQEGGSTFKIYRHREDITITGPDTDGDVAYTFALTYQNVPMIVLRGGQYVTFSNTLGTSVKQKLRLQVLNPTASGFTSRAQILSAGATTAQTDDFASGNSITAAGNTVVVTLNPGSANDDTYTVHYYVTVTVDANASNFCTATLVLAIDADTGSGFVERATFNYAVSPPSGAPPRPAATNTWTHEQQPIVVTGLVNGTQIRIRAKSFSVSNGGTGSFTIRGGDAGGSNPETFNGVTYNTASDTTESAIPAAGDSVQWTAQEVL